MALHSDLLEQARSLATKERKRPKQASLRRATSAAYYALFHFLTQAASKFLIAGASSERELLRQGVARACNHAHMKKTSQAFAHADRANPWLALLQDQPVAVEIRQTARTFVDLQQARAANAPKLIPPENPSPTAPAAAPADAPQAANSALLRPKTFWLVLEDSGSFRRSTSGSSRLIPRWS